MTVGNSIEDWLNATPEGEPAELVALVSNYYERTEAYDRIVCTGPVTLDGVMPANYREMALINRNAAVVLKEVKEQAARLGYTSDQFRAAMKRASR